MLVLAAFVLLVGTVAGQAQTDLIEHVEIFEDVSATLTVDQLEMSAFTPTDRLIVEGYTTSAFWLRLQVRELPIKGSHYYLIIRPTSLDEISLYVPDLTEPGRYRVVHHGSRGSIPEQDYSSQRAFSISPSDDGGFYLVRIASSGSVALQVTALVERDAHTFGLAVDMRQIFYLSLMALLLFWAIRTGILTGDSQYFYFSAMQFFWILQNFFHFGYLTMLFPPLREAPYFYILRSLVIFISIFTLLFHRELLKPFLPPTAALRVLKLLAIVSAASLVVFFVGARTVALKLNSIVMICAPAVITLTAFLSRNRSAPGILSVKISYLVFLVTSTLWVLALTGFLEVGNYTAWSVIIHGCITGGLMFIMLHLHAKRVLKSAQAARMEVVYLAQRRQVEAEHSDVLRRFIEMITHETKNAMAIINMSIAAPTFGPRQRDRVIVSIKALNDVIDHCSYAIRARSGDYSPNFTDCDVEELLREVCDAKDCPDRIRIIAVSRSILKSDPLVLKVIFSNLVENALKYSPSQSSITVTIQPGELRQLVLWFENEIGQTGMPDPARVFDKFYRNSSALSQIGSGMGLYIVRSLLHTLGGSVTYEPVDGRVRFRVCLAC